MIKTHIPYDFDMIDTIANNGAIVDMSQCTFSNNIQQNAKIALIYLKNTGFKQIQLDFSKADTQFKAEILKQYIESCKEFDCIELINTWKCILSHYMQFNDVVFESILSDNEINDFIIQNHDAVYKIASIMKSLPLFLLKKLNTQNTIRISTIDDITKFENLPSLIDNDLLLHICKNHKSEICDYQLIFNDDNIQLFNALNKTDLSFALNASYHLNSYLKQ